MLQTIASFSLQRKGLLLPLCSLILFAASLCFPQHTVQEINDRKKAYERYFARPQLPKLPPSASSDSQFTVVSRWAYGPGGGCAVRDNYAYIGNGAMLQVYDISDPHNPRVLNEYYAGGWVFIITLRDSFAYVSAGTFLDIFDIRNPGALSLLGSIDLETGGMDFILAPPEEDVRDRIYVISAWGSSFIINISDPCLPSVICIFGFPEFPFVSAKGKYLYAGTIESPGAYVINTTDPAHFTYELFDTLPAGSSFVDDTILAVDGRLYSVSDPAHPSPLGHSDEYFGGFAVCGKAGIAYGCEYHRMCVMDYRNPRAPVVTIAMHDAISLTNDAVALGFNNNTLVIPFSWGIQFYDLARSPDSLSLVRTLPTGGECERIAVQDHHAYLACSGAGLWIIDLAEPKLPKAVANFYIGSGSISDVQVKGDYAYVVNTIISANDPSGGLWIVNIADPTHMTVVSHYQGIAHNAANRHALDQLTLADSILFMAQLPYANGQWIDTCGDIINISDPYHPTRMGITPGNIYPDKSIIRDNNIYYLSGAFRCFDIHDPTSPIDRSIYDPQIYGFTFSEHYLYATVKDSIYVVQPDVSSSFTILNRMPYTLPVAGSKHFYVSGKSLVWAGGYLGLLDISDPLHPVHRAMYSSASYGINWAAQYGEEIVVAEDVLGMTILHYGPDPTITFSAGWNLLSLPYHPPVSLVGELFHATSGKAFYYNAGYVSTDTLPVGKGFWVKMGNGEQIFPSGNPILAETIQVHKGWNIVGGGKFSLPTDSIKTQPEGIVISSFYSYDERYHEATSIEPWKGYWVKTDRDGRMILSSATAIR